ncbi:MAG: bacterioferritin-associated ferredoxin [Halorhodospira halophila]|uniref:bacterioferritin-associated ferredoxin n=1 Tax=Halorhodospira TaxID=85108 RepID=UPI001911D77A|nr:MULTISPECIES: bacterioferritin-associated ferredoxin [Halorhodospira]MBK5937544.1 hypothetical protein [Halorhodospira halophila]MBK5943206.1 hypothetical protein [Halorhodospira halophila]MCC3751215.1 bacterioferritin-associated ferredoxin [Halorhodospira halophila]MCG5526727.1 bacterioferritin-associated ferredoxin [Halorhodospira halophila]MCG5533781.1 bacterioferritin-associated ferredoxin [Halorhodospira sp. 9621]
MYVCICNAVTERQIREAVACGCASMRELRTRLGVAGCCGKCGPEARQLLGECADCPLERRAAGSTGPEPVTVEPPAPRAAAGSTDAAPGP